MTTYYVRTDGHDGASGLNNTNNATTGAKLTISAAVGVAIVPGDLVHIVAGTYNENVSNFSSGTVANPIIIEGEGTTTIWRKTGLGGYTNGAVYINNDQNIIFRNIKFDGTNAQATFYGLASGAGLGNSNIQILTCTFSNNGNNGVNDGFTSSSKIIYLNAESGRTNGGHLISGCTFTTNKGYNIRSLNGTGGTVITANDFTNILLSPSGGVDGLEAIHVGSTDDMTITNNVIHDSALGGGIKYDTGSERGHDEGNIIYNLTGSNVIAIEHESGCNDGLIKNNLIYSISSGTAIRIGSFSTNPASGNVVDGNSIWNCPSGIVLGQSGSSVTIQNNLVSCGTGTTYNAIFASTKSTSVTSRNNVFYRNGNVNIAFRNAADANSPAHPANLSISQWEAAVGGTADLNNDPLYVNLTPGSIDLHLQQGSPGVATGYPNNSVDRGAYPAGSPLSTPIISNVQISAVNYPFFTVTWTTDVASNSQINYGLTSAYGSSTTLDASLVLSHSVTVSGLTATTRYHFQVRSAVGASVSLSNDFTATTVIPRPTNVTIS